MFLRHVGLSTNMLTIECVDSLVKAMDSNVDTEHIVFDVSQNYISFVGLKSNLMNYFNEFVHQRDEGDNDQNSLRENFSRVTSRKIGILLDFEILDTMNTEGINVIYFLYIFSPFFAYHWPENQQCKTNLKNQAP